MIYIIKLNSIPFFFPIDLIIIKQGFSSLVQNSSLQKVDVHRQISKLKTLRNIPENEIVAILEVLLQNIVSDRSMIEVNINVFFIRKRERKKKYH